MLDAVAAKDVGKRWFWRWRRCVIQSKAIPQPPQRVCEPVQSEDIDVLTAQQSAAHFLDQDLIFGNLSDPCRPVGLASDATKGAAILRGEAFNGLCRAYAAVNAAPAAQRLARVAGRS
jgi:hypothetical protein